MDVVSILTEEEMQMRLVVRGWAARPAPPYELLLPAPLLERAAQHLGENGHRRLEQLLLWSGYATPQGVVLASLLLPETEATWGWVHILRHEQPKIAEWLRAHGQLLFVEMHTHGSEPEATELSEEDRRHPAGRQDGFLTVIVPGYARRGIHFPRTGVWECRALAWARLRPEEVNARLRAVSEEEVRRVLG